MKEDCSAEALINCVTRFVLSPVTSIEGYNSGFFPSTSVNSSAVQRGHRSCVKEDLHIEEQKRVSILFYYLVNILN